MRTPNKNYITYFVMSLSTCFFVVSNVSLFITISDGAERELGVLASFLSLVILTLYGILARQYFELPFPRHILAQLCFYVGSVLGIALIATGAHILHLLQGKTILLFLGIQILLSTSSAVISLSTLVALIRCKKRD